MLARLEGKGTDDLFVVAKHDEIRFIVEYEKEHQIRWRDILWPQSGATKPLRRLVLRELKVGVTGAWPIGLRSLLMDDRN